MGLDKVGLLWRTYHELETPISTHPKLRLSEITALKERSKRGNWIFSLEWALCQSPIRNIVVAECLVLKISDQRWYNTYAIFHTFHIDVFSDIISRLLPSFIKACGSL